MTKKDETHNEPPKDDNNPPANEPPKDDAEWKKEITKLTQLIAAQQKTLDTLTAELTQARQDQAPKSELAAILKELEEAKKERQSTLKELEALKSKSAEEDPHSPKNKKQQEPPKEPPPPPPPKPSRAEELRKRWV